MKPRTKLQFEVLSCSKGLIDYEHEILSFAKDKCLENKGFATKKRVVCMNCGERFSTDVVKKKRAECPHCQKKLTIISSRCTTDKQHIFIGFAQIYSEFQVIRYFEIYSHHSENKAPKYYCSEILQQWFSDNGKLTIVSRKHNLNAYCDSWGGDMEIRKEITHYYSYTPNKFDCLADFWFPESVFMHKYSKYGINGNLRSITFKQAVRSIPINPRLETLLKGKQYELLSYYYSKGISNDIWASIKICMRNNYSIKDASIWSDYVDLLMYFQKDTHNAFYVCPKNLKKAHDRLVEKKRKIQTMQQAERKRKQANEWEKQFNKMKAHLLGIRFSDGKITIKTLDSVQEYLEEGDALHHCVFTNEYFLRKDSICLSARIDEKPVETIELSLSKMDIVQCRGLHNAITPYHDAIVSLVKDNINVIKSRYHTSHKVKTVKQINN
ncbi:MAG: hypothetical protein A2X18_07530 [Bacteroidetes bacterium GWF2_40_14]|nr:MAG: hypothetical protein A2X18_07530 [Bacteroidetes bacterium GWF2_40_14]